MGFCNPIRGSGLRVNRMSDLISRQAAINALHMHLMYRMGTDSNKKRLDDWINSLPSAQGKPFNLPEIYIADGYDTIEGEDGNVGFGVYVPDENQIYVAGDVEGEIRARALLHEICHWVQDMCGRSFDEDEANEFSDIVYDALPSAHPERTCVNCGRTANNGGWYADGGTRCPIEEHYALPKDGYCHLWEKRNVTDDDYPERRTDE